jgi:hypothetical protein
MITTQRSPAEIARKKSGVGVECSPVRHGAKQHNVAKESAEKMQNVLRSTSGCAAGAWQKLSSYILKAILITSVLGE